MRIPLLVVGALCFAGCTAPPKYKPGGPVSLIRSLGPDEAKVIVAGTYPLPTDGMILVVPADAREGMGAVTQDLMAKRLSFDTVWLRNPGAMCLLLPGQGPPLEIPQRVFVEALAKRHGAQVVKGNQIPIRYGPDGRTPMAVRNSASYLPKEYGVLVLTTVHLTFPTLKAAQQATRYVDAEAYQIKIEPKGPGALLHATANIPRGGVDEEQAIFTPIAAKFGGEFESVSTEGDSPDPF